jgi:hypothetical protein
MQGPPPCVSESITKKSNERERGITATMAEVYRNALLGSDGRLGRGAGLLPVVQSMTRAPQPPRLNDSVAAAAATARALEVAPATEEWVQDSVEELEKEALVAFELRPPRRIRSTATRAAHPRTIQFRLPRTHRSLHVSSQYPIASLGFRRPSGCRPPSHVAY